MEKFFLAQCLVVVFVLIGLLLNQGKKHVRFNRFYFLFVPLFSFGIPFVQDVIPSGSVELLTIELPELIAQGNTQVQGEQINWLMWGYLLGALISVLILIIQFVRARRVQVMKKLVDHNGVPVYLTDNTQQSFSLFRSIYISESQLDSAEYILKHEYAHVKQGHSWDLFYVRIVAVLCWMNPFSYLLVRLVKENHEYLADHATIESEEEVQAYGLALLSAHFGASVPALGNAFNRPSLLRKRITQLTSKNTFTMKQLIIVPAIAISAPF